MLLFFSLLSLTPFLPSFSSIIIWLLLLDSFPSLPPSPPPFPFLLLLFFTLYETYSYPFFPCPPFLRSPFPDSPFSCNPYPSTSLPLHCTSFIDPYSYPISSLLPLLPLHLYHLPLPLPLLYFTHHNTRVWRWTNRGLQDSMYLLAMTVTKDKETTLIVDLSKKEYLNSLRKYF